MIAVMTEADVLASLRTAMHRAKRWFAIHGKRFRLPKKGTKRS
jgi:hypothetical protein